MKNEAIIDRKAARERVIALHNDGLNVPAIAKAVEIPKSTVRYWIDMIGISHETYKPPHRSEDEQEHETKEKRSRIPFYQKLAKAKKPIQWSA